MPQSPTAVSGHLIRYKITSNGAPLGDEIQVVSISVTAAINKVPAAEIVVLDGNMPDQTFPVSDGATLIPGATIEIEAGYNDSTETIFKGIVVRQGLKITGSNYSRLTIDCRDKAIAMTIGRKNANYVDQKDSDVMSTLIGSYAGLSASVSATKTEHRELVQHYCTDWDFVIARAEVNGMLVVTDQNKVTVQEPDVSAAADLVVTWGEDLMEFSADVDSRSQLTSVKSVVWDPAAQAIVANTAAPKPLNDQGNLTSSTLAQVASPGTFRLQTPVPMEQTAVQSWADGQQVKAGLARIRGRMTFQGSSKAKIGKQIDLVGVGARFSGSVYVSSVHHTLSDGNWTTEVEFGMSPDWFADRRDLIAPPAAGLLPGIDGLHLAVVKKLDQDPAGENRVQVSIPLLEAEKDGVWARLSNFYASKTFGDFFIPEIGDEVVLGYLNGDPSYPVILGSLYSSNHTPPYALTADNFTKAIVTKSKLRLIFDDDKKVVTIITPADNKIVISDDDKSILLSDQNGNTAKMSPSGIAMNSPKDITIDAKGKIAISAVGNITIDSKADLQASALNISATANVGFTAKGSATAELSASGQTTVKGAMVMIN